MHQKVCVLKQKPISVAWDWAKSARELTIYKRKGNSVLVLILGLVSFWMATCALFWLIDCFDWLIHDLVLQQPSENLSLLKVISSSYCAVSSTRCWRVSLDGMRINVIRYKSLTYSWKHFQFFFKSFFLFYSYVVVSATDIRKKEA